MRKQPKQWLSLAFHKLNFPNFHDSYSTRLLYANNSAIQNGYINYTINIP